MNVMTLPARPLMEQIEALEQGLPSRTLGDLAKVLALPKKGLIDALRLVQRTVTQREQKGERFSPAESERLFRVIRVRAQAREVFSTDAAVAEWLNEPDRSLGQKTPLQMLRTDLGSQKVGSLLQAMIHGVPV
ncbi:MAG: hypothetical protein JWM88_950 [Verrucomicrobia bacterium]|nr:hypothetical protein [Verrucomicrobiota bacterium]